MLSVSSGRDGARVAGVGSRIFDFALILPPITEPSSSIGLPGLGRPVLIEIVRCQVAFSLEHETVAGEIDEDAVVLLRNAGQQVSIS